AFRITWIYYGRWQCSWLGGTLVSQGRRRLGADMTLQRETCRLRQRDGVAPRRTSHLVSS
ncbi:MAG: hypothetical protein MKZ95_14480, partial [Pirellulales bacterium]|nr:hypothetical protein [Pirellulales bacterium]